MEKTENKYQRGKIYKIISNQTNDVYYGSTIEPYLTNRLSKHRMDYKHFLNGEYHYITSYELLKFDDAKIILVETYSCNTKDELHAREQFYIENNDCVNMRKAWRGQSQKEYDKQRNKKYREENRKKILEYLKQYREKNKEKISEYKKQHHEKNKFKINERKKQNYEKNKLKLNEHINCICGGKYTHQNKLTHEKTIKHQEFIENQKL